MTRLSIGLLFLMAALGADQARAQTGDAIALELVAENISFMTEVTHSGDGSGRLFIARQTGQVVIFDGQAVLPAPFLDVSALTTPVGEQGLLGIAFHPDYAANGLFYISYTDLAGDSVVARYSVSADPDLADPASASVILTIGQPFDHHNVGQIKFGPDGMLYVGSGDGGDGETAEDLNDLLGKVLRIDVDGGVPYAIPPDNPFVGVAGASEEIWVYGLRNPWRFSFDRLTGDLFIADVGVVDREEVDFQPASSTGGENYGWNTMEGSLCFDPPAGCDPTGRVLPILEYEHVNGNCSITGGYPYRGDRYPQLQGIYFYADFCSGRVWGAFPDGAGGWLSAELLDTTDTFTTFGEDEDGELFIAHRDFVGDGRLYRIVPLFPACDVAMTQPVYAEGEAVTAGVFQLANPGPFAVAVEIKAWLGLADGANGEFLSAGADGSLVLPSGLDQDLGPIPLLPVTPGTPKGSSSFNCRLIDPVTGASLVLDQAAFEVQ